jgi:hypothetical protein
LVLLSNQEALVSPRIGVRILAEIGLAIGRAAVGRQDETWRFRYEHREFTASSS